MSRIVVLKYLVFFLTHRGRQARTTWDNMPPKPNKPVRKTRAQRELERKANEEEEARLRAIHEEEERKLREERDAKALEERIRMRNIEVQRFKEHMKQMDEIKVERDNRLCYYRSVLQDEQQWDDTLNCLDKASSTDIRVNMFIAELNLGNTSPLDAICKFCDNVYQLEVEMTAQNLQEKAMGYNMTIKCDKSTVQFLDILETHMDSITNQHLYHLVDHPLKENSNYLKCDKSVISARGRTSPFALDIILANRKDNNGVFEGKFSNATVNVCFSALLEPTRIAIQFEQIPFYIGQEDRYGEGSIVVGSMYKIKILELPPPPKIIDKWNVRLQLNGEREGAKCILSENIDMPIACKITIPNEIIPTESFQIMHMIEKNKLTADSIADFNYNREENAISFHVFSPLAKLVLVQPQILDLPYQNWSISPIFMEPDNYRSNDNEARSSEKKNAVEFLLSTPRFDVVVQVYGSKCILVKPELPQLTHILGVALSPGELLSSLSYCGLHLLPSGGHFVQKEEKQTELEDQFCDDASLLSTAFKIQASVHNTHLGRYQAVYQIKESDAIYDGTNPFPMHLLLMEIDNVSSSVVGDPTLDKVPADLGKVKCHVLEAQENCTTEKLDMTVKEYTESSISPLFCLGPLSSVESIRRAKKSCPLLSHTLKLFLKLVRPLSFCHLKQS